jgi:hypothetical protein
MENRITMPNHILTSGLSIGAIGLLTLFKLFFI